MSSVKGTFRMTTKRLRLSIKFSRTALIRYAKLNPQERSPETLKACIKATLDNSFYGDKIAEKTVSKLKLHESHWNYFCIGVRRETEKIISASVQVDVPMLEKLRTGWMPSRWEVFE